jgi:methionine-rich copper-binding protein CopC
VGNDNDLMRRFTRAAAAGALGLFLPMLLPALPASAHTSLRATSPAPNSTVWKAITAVSLTFSGAPTQPTVTVTGADGKDAGTGPAKATEVVVKQPVGTLPPGAVTVRWKGVSPDGHPVEGSFSFTVAAPGAMPTGLASVPPPTDDPPTTAAPDPRTSKTATTTTDATNATDAAPRSDDSGVSPLWWVLLGVVLLTGIGGGVVFLRSRRRSGS